MFHWTCRLRQQQQQPFGFRHGGSKANEQAQADTSTESQAEAQTEQEIEETEQAKTEQESVSADGAALKEDCYYLMEVNGYIVVYFSDKKTPYEYTDIHYDELPELLRQEIRNGKYIESTAELYGFLENYSS